MIWLVALVAWMVVETVVVALYIMAYVAVALLWLITVALFGVERLVRKVTDGHR